MSKYPSSFCHSHDTVRCISLDFHSQALEVLEGLLGERRGGGVEAAARADRRVVQPQGLVHALEDHPPRYPACDRRVLRRTVGDNWETIETICRHGGASVTRLLQQRQQELKVRTWVTWLYKNQIARQSRQELFRIVRRNCYTDFTMRVADKNPWINQHILINN